MFPGGSLASAHALLPPRDHSEVPCRSLSPPKKRDRKRWSRANIQSDYVEHTKMIQKGDQNRREQHTEGNYQIIPSLEHTRRFKAVINRNEDVLVRSITNWGSKVFFKGLNVTRIHLSQKNGLPSLSNEHVCNAHMGKEDGEKINI
jgi:hypothetical protein